MSARGLVLAALAVLALLPAPVHATGSVVERADLLDEINSVTASYLSAAVDRATAEHAAALVIVTNTPGGLSDAMDSITVKLLNSPVPVVVFVSPPGARAASAGLFVAQAADLVVMAPGTNIGSAHPIDGSGANLTGDLATKVLNDAVARIRELASSHGRNADWCEQAVRASVNVGAEDALRLKVADLIEPSLGALLEALDGRVLTRPHAPTVTLHTAGASIDDNPMPAWQQGLHLLIDPNVAYLLMLVAIFGLITEVTSPGAILPGTLGGIAALLALVSLAGLPLNAAGIGLVLLAFLLFLADIKAPTHGILTVGGVVSLLLGSAFLINTGAVGSSVDPRLILAMTAVSVAVFGFAVRKAVQARSRTTMTGGESMIGAIGEARAELHPEGEIFVAGRNWRAVSPESSVERGASVRVVGEEGGRLVVEPVRRGPQ
ncbi:MAG TPA: nodulation protein NfeD [Candidatus Dormibacteraeota bacterium]